MMVKSDKRNLNEDVSLKKPNKNIIPVITVISLFICGCPGLALIFMGLPPVIDGFNQIVFSGQVSGSFFISYLLSVGLVCLSGIFLLIPAGLVIYLWVQRNKKPPLDPLEPTGISEDEPIPPTH